MKKFLLILLVMSVSFQGALLAQNKTVTGTVTGGDDGLGIPRVNVTVKGTTRGVPTDIDGNYSISVSASETLVYSFVGYISQEVLVGNQTTIDVVLQPDVASLGEIVVVGYGQQDKKEITSASVSISPEEFNKGNIPNTSQLLSGKVAGLSVVRPGGSPTDGVSIRLRGLSTFGGNTSPLIVVDGVIGADLENVDPNDVENVTVLKDASASAIYGARGASGVILITTKGGSDGALQIDASGFVSIDNIANTVDVLSASEFVARGGTDFGSSTDWIDEITDTGVSYSGSVAVSGGTGNTNYRASVTYRDQEGIVEGVGFERTNTRLNVRHTGIDDRLRLNFNLSYTRRDQEDVNRGAFRYAVIYNPSAPIFERDRTGATAEDIATAEADFAGYFQRPAAFDFFNPVALLRQQKFTNQNNQLLVNFDGGFDITDNFTVEGRYSQDRLNVISRQALSIFDAAQGAGSNGVAQRNTFDRYRELTEALVRYQTEFSGNVKFNAVAGFSNQEEVQEGFNVRVRNFLFDEQVFDGNLAFGGVRLGNDTDASSFKWTSTLRRFFGRVNVNIDNKYFITGNIAREGFSGFGPQNKWGTFGGGSVGAELTEIWEDLGPFNQLKARVSYGVTGNIPGDPRFAVQSFNPGNRIDLDGDPLTTGDVFVGFNPSNNTNQFLKWETKTDFNIGFDYSLFNNKITGTMDYYTQNIDDLIFRINVQAGVPNRFDPQPDGSFRQNQTNSTFVNIADLQNGGFEFTVNYNNIPIGPVKWTTGLNFTIYDKTEITRFTLDDLGFDEIRLATPGSPGQNNNELIRNRVGETLGNMYAPRFGGVDENGQYVLLDDRNDPESWQVVGNGLQDGDIGWNNSFTYKNFDFNFFLRGSFGHDLWNSYRGFYENADPGSNTWNSVVTDKTPIVTEPPTASDLYVEDATFLRLDNLTFGYNLPVNNDYISRLRFYFSAQNLFTITDYTGIDPEVRVSDSENGDSFTTNLAPGIERRNTYFTTRTFTFGFNVSFK